MHPISQERCVTVRTYWCVQFNNKPCVCLGHSVILHCRPTETEQMSWWLVYSHILYILMTEKRVTFLCLTFCARSMGFYRAKFTLCSTYLCSWFTLFFYCQLFLGGDSFYCTSECLTCQYRRRKVLKQNINWLNSIVISNQLFCVAIFY